MCCTYVCTAGESCCACTCTAVRSLSSEFCPSCCAASSFWRASVSKCDSMRPVFGSRMRGLAILHVLAFSALLLFLQPFAEEDSVDVPFEGHHVIEHVWRHIVMLPQIEIHRVPVLQGVVSLR